RRGHRFDRLELVAPDEVAARHPLAELLARRYFGLPAHAGEGAGEAVDHLHHVVEHPVLGLHRHSPFNGAQIGTWRGLRHPRSRSYPQLSLVAPSKNSTLPSGPVIGLGTMPSTVHPCDSTQSLAPAQTRSWTAE